MNEFHEYQIYKNSKKQNKVDRVITSDFHELKRSMNVVRERRKSGSNQTTQILAKVKYKDRVKVEQAKKIEASIKANLQRQNSSVSPILFNKGCVIDYY